MTNPDREELVKLEAERAELVAENEAATSWGAAVGARSERIKEIDSRLAAFRRLIEAPADAGMREALERIPAARSENTIMNDDQIKHMVDRFLGWTLPENFNPDGGVSFKRLENRHHHPNASTFYPMPVGTNLFDAVQATAMVRHMLEGLPSTRSDVTVGRGIYIASKTKHADRWKRLRSEGVPIISTWIDEAGAGETSDFHDLWHRCLTESANCAVLVSYREPDEVLKGGWVEIGAALAKGVPVYAVGLEEFTIASYRGITHFPTVEAAIGAARALLETHEIRRK